MTQTKKCTKCGETKAAEHFSLVRRGDTRLRPACKQCRSSQNNRYNSESYVPRNREKVAEYQRAYYQQNREKLDARAREYARSRPEIDRDKLRRRRAIAAGSPVVDLTREQWELQLDYFGSRCAYCNALMTEDSMDHIVPLASQGDHSIANVVPSCQSCNSKKGDRSLLYGLVKGYLR